MKSRRLIGHYLKGEDHTFTKLSRRRGRWRRGPSSGSGFGASPCLCPAFRQTIRRPRPASLRWRKDSGNSAGLPAAMCASIIAGV
jgi:hypothetical protein